MPLNVMYLFLCFVSAISPSFLLACTWVDVTWKSGILQVTDQKLVLA